MHSAPDPEPGPGRQADMAVEAPGSLDRAVRHDLERVRTESLLARQDAVNELTRAIHDAPLIHLSVSEITDSLARLEGQSVPSMTELEGLLAAPEARGLTMDSGLLTDLLKAGGEGQEVIKKGLVFLKHGRYAEAAEWWSLHHQGLDPATSRLSLLLLVLETLTRLWSGDRTGAEAARTRVLSHPLYRSPPARPR